MLFQLKNTSTNTIREVKPSGNYSFIIRRDNHRYYESLEGGIIFTGDDFAWIMQEGECVEFELTCNLRKTWKGLFTQADASMIDLSKRQMEVTPRHDDDYSKIEGWMGIDFNIIPPYKGIKKEDLIMPAIYRTERKTAIIDKPYTGTGAENWKGYSVNDWIRGQYVSYAKDIGRINSLIYELTFNLVPITYPPFSGQYADYTYGGMILSTEDGGRYTEYIIDSTGSYISEIYLIARHKLCFNHEIIGDLMESRTVKNWGIYYTHPTDPKIAVFWYSDDIYPLNTNTSDQDNQLLWLDYSGYERYEAAKKGSAKSLYYWLAGQRAKGELFTLVEVVNYFDDENNWEYCELIYEREVHEGLAPPPTGTFYTDDDKQNPDFRVRGWYYNEDQKIWIRRPYDVMWNVYVDRATDWLQQPTRTGDGYWFTKLEDGIKDGKPIRSQKIYRNQYVWKYYVENYPSYVDLWYFDHRLYNFQEYDNISHNIADIVKKYLLFIQDEQTGKEGIVPHDFELESRVLDDAVNPITSDDPNPLKNAKVIQNSDLRRPLSTERATKQEYTFEAFLNIICDLFNLGWAVIDGKFVVEHIKYFENGLTYTEVPESMLLNPYSIKNTALSKSFMEFSDIYNFDKPRMPKFEQFETVGGEEPINNKTRIEYWGGCVNNKPRENTNEITIDSTTDVRFTISEGVDSGITFLFTYYGEYRPDWFGILGDNYWFIPEPCDKFGKFTYNKGFTLEDLIKAYHFWGRTRDHASLNGKDWGNLTPNKNILQTIHFPLKKDNKEGQKLLNSPYTHVLTGIGEGIINQVEYNPRTNMLEFQLGFGEVNPYALPPDEVDIMNWHIHEQYQVASKTWVVIHDMNTQFVMKPVVFDGAGNEIEYDNFKVIDNNRMEISFTHAVIGEAHFISLRPLTKYQFQGYGEEHLIEHNFNISIENIAMSAIFDSGNNEVKHSYLEVINNNTLKIKFTQPATCRITLSPVGLYYLDVHDDEITDSTEKDMPMVQGRVYNKPLILMADKQIFYNYQKLEATLRKIGFSENVTARIIVMEKNKTL